MSPFHLKPIPARDARVMPHEIDRSRQRTDGVAVVVLRYRTTPPYDSSSASLNTLYGAASMATASWAALECVAELLTWRLLQLRLSGRSCRAVTT